MTAETPLEMAERHVIEGQVRVARQEQLVSDFAHGRRCTEQQWDLARALLTTLQETLEAARGHLELERGKKIRGLRDQDFPLTRRPRIGSRGSV